MEKDRSATRFLVLLVVTAFILNWFWEMFQMPGYAEMAGKSWAETAGPCAFASLGDVVMTLAISGLGALASANIRWAMERHWNVLLTAALLGALFAIAYEWRSLAFGRWSYTPAMPMVPLLGVGLSPLAQLVLLTPLSFAVAGSRRWDRIFRAAPRA